MNMRVGALVALGCALVVSGQEPVEAIESSVDVVFSPQAGDATHLARVAAMIDEAVYSIDIAMYSYSHQNPIKTALQNALERGVKIRFLANTANANSNSKAGNLERLGTEFGNFIDVRRVTKIMHHKFAIIDGPRDDATVERANTAAVVSGSANWSGSAASIYDENTLFLKGYPELVLRLQRDFNTLWLGSKDVVWVEGLVYDETAANIDAALIAKYEDSNTDALLTSFNFKPTASRGWSKLGTWVVTDALVAAISSATTSINIAQGHFLNVRIATAIRDQLLKVPGLIVNIVIDCQDVSKSGDIAPLKNEIASLGGSVTYKCSTFRWHYKYAKQMHHKYMIIDGKTLYTGSYNWSPNSETDTFENVLVLSGEEHAQLISQFQTNFRVMQTYGGSDAVQSMLRDVETALLAVPLVWEPFTTDKPSFDNLRRAIRKRCPASGFAEEGVEPTPEQKTFSTLFNSYPQYFLSCNLDPNVDGGYPWPKVPLNKRVLV